MAKGDRREKMSLNPYSGRHTGFPYGNNPGPGAGKRYRRPDFSEPPWGEGRGKFGTVFSRPRKILKFHDTSEGEILLKPGSSVTVKLTPLRKSGDFDTEVSLRSLLARYGLHAVPQGNKELILTNRGPHDFPLWRGMEVGRNLPHPDKLSPLTRKEVLKLIKKGQLHFPPGFKVRKNGQVEVYLLHLQGDLFHNEWGTRVVDSDFLRQLFRNPFGRMKFDRGTQFRRNDQPEIKLGEFVLASASPLHLPPKVFAVINKEIICARNGKRLKRTTARFSSSRGIDPGYKGPVYVEAFLPRRHTEKPVQLHKIVLTLHEAKPELVRKVRRQSVEKQIYEAARQGLIFDEV